MIQDNLRAVIVEQREEILRTWSAAVQLAIGACKLTLGELRDHLPSFLDDLALALAPDPAADGTFRASQHGRQRLRVGFDVAAVVRDYALLGDAILGVADSTSYRPTVREHRILLGALSDGASEAVTAYAARRDAEVRAATDQHLAFVAHELRNPLVSAKMSLSMLNGDGVVTDFAAKRVHALERSIGRLCDLVDHVLVTDRSYGQVEVHAEGLVLADLLEDARAEIAPHAETRAVSLRCEADSAQLFHADRRLILSALGNVVRNAVKFTKPGGRVVMRARRLASNVVFEVEDQCGGLPPGKAAELFQPFVQRGADRSGSGLGLAIAKHAVEAHGGTIHALDRPGSGCAFVMEIPVGAS